MEFEFTNPIFEWRGPAPVFYIELPEEIAAEISAMSKQLTYGWGVIPVEATIGKTTYTTSLFPKNGGYLLGVKTVVREPEKLKLGDSPNVTLRINL
jgi:hypothetical protein